MTWRMVDLFSGIGCFSWAAQHVWDDLEIVTFCEQDKFCQRVLKKHWPTVPILEDVRDVAAYTEILNDRGISRKVSEQNEQQTEERQERWTAKSCGPNTGIDLLTGGFPCQPASCAGQRKGTADDRWLWPPMLEAIRQLRPRWIIAENVPGLLTLEAGLVFEGVCVDLENEGYEVQPLIVPACAKGAPHRRDRVWIVANRKSEHGTRSKSIRDGSWKPEEEIGNGDRHAADTGRFGSSQCQEQATGVEQCGGDDPDTKCWRRKSRNKSAHSFRGEDHKEHWQEHWYSVALRACVRGVDDGASSGLHRTSRLKALGNAIVWQVAAEIMRAIRHAEEGGKHD